MGRSCNIEMVGMLFNTMDSRDRLRSWLEGRSEGMGLLWQRWVRMQLEGRSEGMDLLWQRWVHMQLPRQHLYIVLKLCERMSDPDSIFALKTLMHTLSLSSTVSRHPCSNSTALSV